MGDRQPRLIGHWPLNTDMPSKTQIPQTLLDDIHAHVEAAYPEESAGLLLGRTDNGLRVITAIMTLPNAREKSARHNRYLITSRDMLHGEREAMKRGLDIIGVFHSHPDHPNHPSAFDREWAMPWFSYLITSVQNGRAAGTRSWRLTDDRSKFEEEELQVETNKRNEMRR